MKDFFKGVRKHIDRLDAEHLREQYEVISNEAEFFDRILNTIDRGIIVISADGAITFFNPYSRELLGMEPEDAVKHMPIPLGKDSKREIEINYPVRRCIEISTTNMNNGSTLVVLRDVTADRERTEEELRAGATQAVRDLASGVAHEIGNPLNAISIDLQLMERSDVKEPEMLASCRQQIERLDGILKGFLQALKPSKPVLVPGNAADPLKNCLSMLRHQLEGRRISVTLNVPAALPQVALDSHQIEQVYFNLLKNALEAMREGGAIAISVSSDDNDVTVAFHDTGVGMTAEQLTHLFEPYRTSKEHGTGLGLMISQRIVRDHGGSIDVESVLGSGTVFTVRLPRIERRIRQLQNR